MNKKLKRTRQLLVALIIATLVIGISSCEQYSFTPEVVNTVDTVYFQTEIQTIFTANCVTCHGAIQSPILKTGKAYNNLVEGGFVDQPGETSKLYLKMIDSGHSPKSTDVEKQKVLIWINQGALNN